jgi:uncharacterized protein YvpB
MSMSQGSTRRRSPPFVVWLILVGTTAAVLACIVLGLWAWQQNAQIQMLQGELDALQHQHQAALAQFVALQSTATVQEERLAILEARDPAQQLEALRQALETADTPQQVSDLRGSFAEIQARVTGFQTSLDDLTARLQALESSRGGATQALPPEVHLPVARQRQSHNLSCESSAASMAAQYHGIPLGEADVLAALPRNDNPHLGFRGNVDGPTGDLVDYGVYAGPIAEILNSQGLQAWSIEDGLPGIRAALARGNPVLAWITFDCQPQTPTTVVLGDQELTLVPYQHVVVVTGYNSEGLWANDPWDGQEDYYATAVFERAMSYFGHMAIEVRAP